MTDVRNDERRPVALPGSLKTPRSRQEVAVSNLSTIGCKVEAIYLSLAAGEHVTITPKGLQMLPATVIWCSGPSAGLLFESPLHPAVLDNLCRLHPDAKHAVAASP